MTYKTYKSECIRLIEELHGVPQKNLFANNEELMESFKLGTKPIDIALEFKLIFEDEI